MMNSVKNIFSIKDLENLSGIKAHTIRIWEKRYAVLSPMRTDSNIRYYDIANLQKLLNITLLHNHGYKISKISKYPPETIPKLVNEIISEKSVRLHAINAFKMAMMNFDQKLFFETYDTLLRNKSFREIFFEVVIPMMEEIGLLWQTNTITPAHEHFFSYLIKQKLLINTEKVQVLAPTKLNKVFVLFLPLNEVHELGLMYLNYEILSAGYKTIYLGESIPLDNLKDLTKYFSNIVYLSSFTVEPTKDDVADYVAEIESDVLEADSELWLLGRISGFVDPDKVGSQVRLFKSIVDVVDEL